MALLLLRKTPVAFQGKRRSMSITTATAGKGPWMSVEGFGRGERCVDPPVEVAYPLGLDTSKLVLRGVVFSLLVVVPRRRGSASHSP
jgi:hypothetical protein